MQEFLNFALIFILVSAFSASLAFDVKSRRPPGLFTWFLAGVVFSYAFSYTALKLSGIGFYAPPENPADSSAGFLLLLVSCLLVFAGYRAARSMAQREIPTHLPRKETAFRRRPLARAIVALLAVYTAAAASVSLYAMLKYRSAVTNSDTLRSVVYTKIQWITLDGALTLLPVCLLVMLINRYACTKRKRYLALFAGCLLMALPVALVTGERTNVILTILLPMVEYCRCKKKIRYAALPALIAAVFTGLYTLFFKNVYASGGAMAAGVLKKDIDMNWTLWTVFDNAGPAGCRIAPFNGFGYLNSLLAFVPRSVLPLKGLSSSAWFTAFMQHASFAETGGYAVSFLNWGYKFGWVTELILNFGFLGVAFSIIYGFLIGLFENIMQDHAMAYPFFAYLCFSVSFLTSFTLTSLLTVPILAAVLLNGVSAQDSKYG